MSSIVNTSIVNSIIDGNFDELYNTQTSNGQYFVNAANIINVGGFYSEREPPKDPYASPFDFAGFGFKKYASTPRTARGVVDGTVIGMTNVNLSHGCLIFGDFASLLGGGLMGEIQQLTQLPPSKIQASAYLRIQFNGLIQELRDAINKILDVIGFDCTGIISYIYSQAKSILRMINYWLKNIKQLLADILSIIQFINQLFAIIQYLLSLPAQLLAAVQGCISSFLGSIMGMSSTFENIPNMLENNVMSGTIGTISTYAEQALSYVTQKSNDYNQINPNSFDVTTATSETVQNAINAVTPPLNTYTNKNSTISDSYSKAVKDLNVYTTRTPEEVANEQIFSMTATQNVVMDILSANTIYANNIYANTIICYDITVRANTIANTVNTKYLSINTMANVAKTDIPNINGNSIILPTAYPVISSNTMKYHEIVSDTIYANTISCDNLICNNIITISHSMVSKNLSSNTLIANSIFIIDLIASEIID